VKTSYRRKSSILLVIFVLAFGLNWADVYASVPAQTTQGQTLQQCNVVAEDTLQDELNRVTQQVFTKALATVDINAIVAAQWNELGVDTVMDSEIDRAVAHVKSQKDLLSKFLSSWSADKAQELTRDVASQAFQSEAFRGKIDALSTAVADALSHKIATMSAESVSAAFFCLQTFIQGNYAKVMVSAFEQEVQTATAKAQFASGSGIDTSILTIIGQHKSALGGLGVIVAAQVTRRIMVSIGETIADRVAGQIVTRVLGRIGTDVIPLVGWLIGAGLIVYDIYNSLDGALPQIQASLKSPDVKAGIRDEIVASVKPELEHELPQIARNIANDLFSEWRNVKKNIRQVLDLAAANPNFKTILDRMGNADDLAKLVNAVAVTLPVFGQDGLNKAIADGSLERLLTQPASSYKIIETTKSVQSALDWSTQAGTLLDKVVEFEIYKHKAPTDLDKSVLQQLLVLDNRSVIDKLTLLEPKAIEALLTVSTSNLKTLTTRLSTEDLQTLATLLPMLSAEQKNQFVARALNDPEIVAHLSSPAAQKQLAASQDIDAALGFLATPKDVAAIFNDVSNVLFSGVSWRLFVYKYGSGQTTTTGIVLLIIVLVLLRLIYALLAWFASPLTGLFKR
jgi:hypothetical protein